MLNKVQINKKVAIVLIMFSTIFIPVLSFAADIFAPASNYEGASGDFGAIATGDLNRDGNMDIVTVSATGWWVPVMTSSIKILFGNGDGTFRYSEGIVAGIGRATAFNIDDFSGDGYLDIAVSVINYDNNNSISNVVLFGNGDGTFQPKEEFDSADYGRFFPDTNSDFNNDGNVDLAVISTYTSTVSVSLGNSDGTFQPVQELVTGASPCGLTISDFNGDLKPDLATVNNDGWSFSIFIGNGDGTFQPMQEFATATKPWIIKTGDFDGDEKIDVVIVEENGKGVYLHIGNGDGTFQTPTFYGTSWGYIEALATADLNDDGRLDLITSNWWNPAVSIYLNISPQLMANAGSDQTIESVDPLVTQVTLDGSGSYDPEGDAFTYAWTWAGGSAVGVNPTVTLPMGTTVLTLTVSNGKTTASNSVNITVCGSNMPVTAATGDSSAWYNTNRISTFTASDSCSGVKEIHYFVDGLETVISGGSASVTITTDGIHNISYFAVGNAGNAESPKEMIVMIDKTVSTGSVVINSDAASTTSTSVILTLAATDNLSGVSQMRFSNDGTSWSAWEPYNTSKNWTLSNTSDLMTVYAQFIDNAGNISVSYNDTIKENPISDLIAAFRGVNIQDESTWENLMNQLTRACDEYEGGDNEDVKDDLRTFINKLESGSREKIGQQDTDMLIQFANEIIARL